MSSIRLLSVILVLVLSIVSMGAGAPDAAEAEKREVDCGGALIKMQACRPFVSNQISIPGSDCCKALLFVHLNSPVCLCKLLDASPEASANGINVTTALLLPQICKVQTDPKRCPALLAGAPEPSLSENAKAPESAAAGLYIGGGVTSLFVHLLAYLVIV